MAQVTGEILALTLAGIKTNFDDAYRALMQDGNVSRWQQIATPLETTLATQNYAWLGQTVVMETLKDRPREQQLVEYSYRVSDNIEKGRLKIARKDLEDDQYGLLRLRASMMAEAAVRRYNSLVFSALNAGFTTYCYDGQYLFDSDHQSGTSPVQSNITSAPLSSDSLNAAAIAMKSYKDDKGEVMEVTPDTLIVGPENERMAWQLTESAVAVITVGSGTASTGATAATDYANYHRGKYKVVVDPRITYGNWFLADTKRVVKPIVLQMRSDVPVTVESNMLDPSAYMQEEYWIDVRGRFVAAYGLWQTVYGSNATTVVNS